MGGELSGHGGGGLEITSGGPGSESDNCCGITTEIKPGGFFRIATEDKRGVSRVPNLGNDYFITWAADKDDNNVRYRGYLLTMDGRQYKIADLTNTGIDFTQQNTYIRGRTNQLGNVAPTGQIFSGSYQG